MTDAALVKQIDAWLALPGSKARYDDEDERVLRYIRSQITPEGLAARPEHYENIIHLHEVARQRLAPYRAEMEGTSHDNPQ